jgi:hypothetical protein
MARSICSYMLASFFVGALISKADACSWLLLVCVHVMDDEEYTGRSCKRYCRGSARGGNGAQPKRVRRNRGKRIIGLMMRVSALYQDCEGNDPLPTCQSHGGMPKAPMPRRRHRAVPAANVPMSRFSLRKSNRGSSAAAKMHQRHDTKTAPFCPHQATSDSTPKIAHSRAAGKQVTAACKSQPPKDDPPLSLTWLAVLQFPDRAWVMLLLV